MTIVYDNNHYLLLLVLDEAWYLDISSLYHITRLYIFRYRVLNMKIKINRTLPDTIRRPAEGPSRKRAWRKVADTVTTRSGSGQDLSGGDQAGVSHCKVPQHPTPQKIQPPTRMQPCPILAPTPRISQDPPRGSKPDHDMHLIIASMSSVTIR